MTRPEPRAQFLQESLCNAQILPQMWIGKYASDLVPKPTPKESKTSTNHVPDSRTPVHAVPKYHSKTTYGNALRNTRAQGQQILNIVYTTSYTVATQGIIAHSVKLGRLTQVRLAPIAAS